MLLHCRLAGPFLIPVDPVDLEIPDYFDVITSPMDLATISNRLQSEGDGGYASREEVWQDLRQIFRNCFTYNLPSWNVHIMGRGLEVSIGPSLFLSSSCLGCNLSQCLLHHLTIAAVSIVSYLLKIIEIIKIINHKSIYSRSTSHLLSLKSLAAGALIVRCLRQTNAGVYLPLTALFSGKVSPAHLDPAYASCTLWCYWACSTHF